MAFLFIFALRKGPLLYPVIIRRSVQYVTTVKYVMWTAPICSIGIAPRGAVNI